MWKASILKIVRLAAAWIFFGWGHEKSQKNDFFHKTLISQNLLKEANIQARSMWKLTSRAFRKCGTYWACHVFNGSYRPSKMDESEKTGPSPQIRGVKKKTRTHFFIFCFETNSTSSQPRLKTRLFVSDLKNWNRISVFFLAPPLQRIFSSIFTRLWQPITLV